MMSEYQFQLALGKVTTMNHTSQGRKPSKYTHTDRQTHIRTHRHTYLGLRMLVKGI